jgi:hypothetical protein
MKALAWDDKPQYLEELKVILKEDYDINLEIETKIRSFLARYKKDGPWDFVVIDLVQEKESGNADPYAGYELAQKCREISVKLPIFIVTSHQAAISRRSIRIQRPSFICSKDMDVGWMAMDIYESLESLNIIKEIKGKKVFIGHGHSVLWKDLKEFIQDRLNLEWEEFNHESPAGINITERLTAMLDEACFAFHILTAEDEHRDGSKHARENVIYEAGLFTSKLGFQRAIILLEEGCEEFSNIYGLGFIRFPKGNIRAIFEDVRKVLERERIIKVD